MAPRADRSQRTLTPRSSPSFTAGPVTIAFKAPAAIAETDFNDLFILHNENGTYVLSFYGVNDRSFFYTVKFEVK